MQNLVVEVVVSIEELKVFSPKILDELGLAVDSFVVVAEESVDQLAIFWCDTFEAMFLDLAELCNHLLVNLEILRAILTGIAEWLSPQSHKGEQTGHEE